jgi:predicted dehydrogenase/threonine dehydrogenase-like Zn-dependent dehydrogenase
VKQVFFRQGAVVVEDVPPPALEEGSVLVRTAFSCLSPGTELSGMRASGKPLWARVFAEPEKVRKAVDMVLTRGLDATLRTVREKVDAARPTGYSAAGTVIAVGAGVSDLRVGDRVACAGAEHAFHAEVIRVPRNLCVPVPPGLALDAAATVTLGAIALQGVRRAQPTLGETFAVIGLGLLGQLTVQLLKANGCRVIAMDIDAARVEQARSQGADTGLSSDDAAVLERIYRATDGHGADGAIITAASSSDALVSLAFRLCRKKGRVVLVGDVGLNLKRADIYEKELDFLVSTSYGPGRYDRRYEEEGLDYPIGQVRWTENRNMQEYLALLSDGRVRPAALLDQRHGVEQAAAAYAALADGQRLGALLVYPDAPGDLATTVRNPAARPGAGGKIRLALVGAGNFARQAHLPVLATLADRCAIHAVMSRTGHNAQETARSTGAAYGTSDFQAILDDKDVDAVLVATRHDLHADYALRALRAGKHVLLEKPLALRREDLAALRALHEGGTAMPVLLTGYNRRFSPHAVALAAALRGRTGPVALDYRVNAGALPADHWLYGAQGGGRNLGEACHMYDLFGFLTGARCVRVQAQAGPAARSGLRRDDNFAATLAFDDGSVATLLYTALGDPSQPKERLDCHWDGRSALLDDFRRLEVSGAERLETRAAEKGLREQWIAFLDGASRGEPPAPLWQQWQAAAIAFDVEDQLASA